MSTFAKIKVQDGAGTDLTSTGGALDVNLKTPTVVPINDNGGSLTVDGSVTSAQGAAAALTGKWPVQVTDGTNTMPTGDSSGRSIHTTIDNASLAVTNPQSNQTADYDSGAGTQTTTMFGIALPASGGPVAGGTDTNPLRTDPTGTTTQPVSGTVTANATLSAETTKVIGTVNVASGQTVGIVAGTAVIGHVIADSGSTVAVTSLPANASVNNAQVNGGAVVTSVTGVQDVMPRKRTGATGLSPNYSALRITSKTTTTVTAATAYVNTITIACSAAGSAWTLVIQNKEATAKILVPSITLALPTAGPIVINFTEPILMTSGIDIVTAGTTAGTVDVYVTYWQ